MDDPNEGTSPEEKAAAAFAAEVTYWRDVRGLSKRGLAAKMGFDASYVSHVEAGRHKPTGDFAQRADQATIAGGAIVRRWTDYDQARRAALHSNTPGTSTPTPAPAGAGAAILVTHDEARLDYDGSRYRLTMRRRLENTGGQPVTRYLVRISVDRYPGEPERSNAHYRANPLTWDELSLTASCQGEPMAWSPKHDRDAFKEVWLLFENDHGRFPLYPGESTWIEYAYTVTDTKWGNWFQRAVRLPTSHLSVTLAFPSNLKPAVWGTETSMVAEAFPLRTAIHRQQDGDSTVFSWSTDDPPLHARYRLEWRFRARPHDEE